MQPIRLPAWPVQNGEREGSSVCEWTLARNPCSRLVLVSGLPSPPPGAPYRVCLTGCHSLSRKSKTKVHPPVCVYVCACFPSLPVVPGIIFSFLDFLRLRKLALYLEDLFGGRVGVFWRPRAGRS